MRFHIVGGLAFLACVIVAAQPAAPQTASVESDYPGFGHIEGYRISNHNEIRFDRFSFVLPDHEMTVEGHVLSYQYKLDGSQPPVSQIELYRSYKEMLERLGAQVLQYNEAHLHGLTARLSRNGTNIYVDIDGMWNGGDLYNVNIVEEKPFRSMIPNPAAASKP